jgi:hypothetical protein
MAGAGVFGANPIAAKALSIDRRQTGLQHFTHAPATPWDCKSAIVGGATFPRRETWRGADMVPI